MKYFAPEEFACRCGCGRGFEQMDRTFLQLLDEMRGHAGMAFVLNSAYRCLPYNTSIGGAKRSAHTKGLAVDIRTESSRERYSILDAAFKLGIPRIGIGQYFLHIDNDYTLPLMVAWDYYE